MNYAVVLSFTWAAILIIGLLRVVVSRWSWGPVSLPFWGGIAAFVALWTLITFAVASI